MAKSKENNTPEQDGQLFQVNEFYKGQILDVDNLKMPPNATRENLNVRFLNKEGQGYVATTLGGNEVEFQLTEDFIPIGWCVFDDVLYIASCKNDDTGEGEVGCFPSPNFAAGTNQFERVYRPLYNRSVAGVRGNLRTTAFNWIRTRQVKMFGVKKYNGSVDMFICDHHNPNYVINSGFDQQGDLLSDEYMHTDADFASTIPQILRGSTTPVIATSIIYDGGNLKYGMYFVYIRYVDKHINRTMFATESNAFQVYDGERTNAATVQGGNSSDRSRKQIYISLTNCDTTYKYVEAAVVRFHGDDNGEQVYETYLVDKRYEINSVTGVAYVDITGSEGTQTLSVEDVIEPQLDEDTSKDHTILENRYWGINWKKRSTHDDLLESFAELIQVNFDDSLQIDGEPIDPAGDVGTEGQYKDDEKTYNNVGYFRGEPYAFSVLFEWTNGLVSEAYHKLIGYDSLTDNSGIHAVPGNENNNGVFRFPDNERSPMYENLVLNIMGVKFSLAAAVGAIYTPNKAWFDANIRGIYFCRSDRHVTLKYQGLAMSACLANIHQNEVSYTWRYTLGYGAALYNHNNQNSGVYYKNVPRRYWWADAFWGNESNPADVPYTTSDFYVLHQYFPVYRGYAPMVFRDNANEDFFFYVARMFMKPNKYAIYSPDMMFQESNDITGINFVKRVARTIDLATSTVGNWLHTSSYNDPWDGVTKRLFPMHTLAEVSVGYLYNTQREKENIALTLVGEDDFSKQSGGKEFLNYAGSLLPGNSHSEALCHSENSAPSYQWSNRCMITPKYISLDLLDKDDMYTDGVAGSLNETFNLDIVNLYTCDIYDLDIDDLFGKGTKYYKISELIKTEDFATYNDDDIYYNGDCFLQRTYFKQMYWHQAHGGLLKKDDLRGDNPVGTVRPLHPTHGVVIGIVTENAVNTAMRHDIKGKGNTYYPKNGDAWNLAWKDYSADGTGVEALTINPGYSRTLSVKSYNRRDDSIPETKDNFFTRIRNSNENVPGAIYNQLRVIKASYYKDFDEKYGEMVGVFSIHDYLITVQNDTINQHYISEKQLQNDPSGVGSLVIGVGEIMSDRVKRLSNYGSEHQWSIFSNRSSAYGVDWKKRIIWRVGLTEGKTSTFYPDAKDISKLSYIQQWIYDLFDSFNDKTDRTNILYDNPAHLGGIVTGYDEKYSEVLFTFILNKTYEAEISRGGFFDMFTIPSLTAAEFFALFTAGTEVTLMFSDGTTLTITLDASGYIGSTPYAYYVAQVATVTGDGAVLISLSKSTQCFAEDLQAFTGEYSFTPNMYFGINKDFFSYIKTINTTPDDVYLHNSEITALTFYGVPYDMYITYIVNKFPGEKKIFAFMEIDTLEQLFSEFLYNTELQSQSHTPIARGAVGYRIWVDPEYKEDTYYTPIHQEAIVVAGVTRYRPLRGLWLRVRIKYNGNAFTFIRKVKTHFQISKS